MIMWLFKMNIVMVSMWIYIKDEFFKFLDINVFFDSLSFYILVILNMFVFGSRD